MTPPTSSHLDAVLARAHGTALTDALTAVARGGDLEPVLASADTILAEGFYIGTRGELIAGMLYRLQLHDYDAGVSTADYFGLSKRLVDKGICTAADMKSATCGEILMRGLTRGWLEPELYDRLAKASRGYPDWERAMSMIARGNPGPFMNKGASEDRQ